MKIKCYCDLYISESLRKRKNRVLMELMERKLQLGITVITLSSGEQNHLEYFSSLLLQQRYYDDKELFVVGLAEGDNETTELIRQITQGVLDETQGTDIRGYIMEKQKKFEESRA